MVVGVDGFLPKDAKGGEQAYGVCGDQVEVQAEAWGDLYYSSEVRGLGLGGVLYTTSDRGSDHSAHRDRRGLGTEQRRCDESPYSSEIR